jgi:uncharacterized protein YrrD
MKASELKGRAVISLAEAHKLGEVENILFDLSACQVAGFRVKQGLFSSAQLLSAADVQSIGPDAMMIPSREVLHDRESNADLNSAPDLDDLGGIKVVTESGIHVGVLGDAELDPQTMMLTTYYLGESLWEHLTHGSKSFTATPTLRFGGKLLIIPDALAVPLIPGAEAPTETAPPPAAEEALPLPPPTPLAGGAPDSPFARGDALAPPVPPAELALEPPPVDLPIEPPPAVADAAPTPYPAGRLASIEESDLDRSGRLRPAEESGSGGGTP